jgi:hypothetical protein
MSRWVLVLMGLLVCASPAGAQAVLNPEPPLDSARATVRDALLVLRDTLNTIDAAAARLQRDFRQASGESLLSRARVMRDACARSIRTVPPTRKAVAAIALTEPRKVERRAQLLAALGELREALVRCDQQFTSMSRDGQAETVRGYGNDRAGRVQAALRKYEMALRGFFGVMKIRVQPLGAPERPLAG